MLHENTPPNTNLILFGFSKIRFLYVRMLYTVSLYNSAPYTCDGKKTKNPTVTPLITGAIPAHMPIYIELCRSRSRFPLKIYLYSSYPPSCAYRRTSADFHGSIPQTYSRGQRYFLCKCTLYFSRFFSSDG